MKEIIIKTKNVSKLYGSRKEEAEKMLKNGIGKNEVLRKTGVTTALYDINLEIPKGEIFVIIGLSGSGKSTIVRCFNRIIKPTSGEITFDGQSIMDMNKKELREFRRNKIAMVFQSFGLMDHRDVLGNVAYGLEVKGVDKEEREKLAKEAISLVGLDGWENAPIVTLSGGMKQRVGLARALANDPEVLLMDEPFSALDPLVRKDMQFELLSIQRKLGKTVIFITHDIDEAFKLGDRIAIMRDGRLIQVDTPEQMSSEPKNEYVRKFIDSADMTKVLTASNVMITGVSFVKKSDSLDYAIKKMEKNSYSSVFVVGKKMQLEGVLTLEDAQLANKENRKIASVTKKARNITRPDILIEELLEKNNESSFPIAVIDKSNRLKGIVTKASILKSLS